MGIGPADREVAASLPPPQVEQGPRVAAPDRDGVSVLHEGVGNQAMQSFAADRLESEELAGPEFDAAYHDQPPLQVGDARVRAVRQLQTLLADRFDLRAHMPNTFKTGVADGAWGPETTRAVRDFQQRHDVLPVGGWEAGRKTLGAMDRALLRTRPIPRLPA